MTDIRLISKRDRQIKPLVEAALANELRLLETGIRQTKERLQEFEKKYQMLTQDFIFRYDNTGHHKNLNLSTYPHHKHEGCANNVVPSVTKDLANVLKEIESLIKY